MGETCGRSRRKPVGRRLQDCHRKDDTFRHRSRSHGTRSESCFHKDARLRGLARVWRKPQHLQRRSSKLSPKASALKRRRVLI
jgi:hypothetical protein